MRLIHCADLHLDSNMTTYLSKEKAKERKAELLRTFFKMVEYAGENEVDAILIAGDLFDKKNISVTARRAVWQTMVENPTILFYYLQGNHDVNFSLDDEEMPKNLRCFGTEWTSYVHQEGEHRLVITGLELTAENASYAPNALTLAFEDRNIVMLHGQDAEYEAKDKTEVIPLRQLRGKGIDYLALGHVHRYKKETLDSRGTYCYPGCLEGRGFDECGEHGFVVLDVDIENGEWNSRFFPFASRRFYCVPVDICSCQNSGEILSRIREQLVKEECTNESLIKVVLTGETEISCEKDTDYLLNWLKDDYYYVRIKDESKVRIDYAAYALDESLKGEFVRLVQSSDEIADADKGAIIQYGIKALAGEEWEV